MTLDYAYLDRFDDGSAACAASTAGDVLTPEQAEARYACASAAAASPFTIVQVTDCAAQSRSELDISPGGQRAVMRRLNEHGSVTASYEWAAADAPDAPHSDVGALFLHTLTWYVYPGEEAFFATDQAVSTVTMTFTPDGHVITERTTEYRIGNPGESDTREYDSVDVTPNWVSIPEFGHWDEFFEPVAA